MCMKPEIYKPFNKNDRCKNVSTRTTIKTKKIH